MGDPADHDNNGVDLDDNNETLAPDLEGCNILDLTYLSCMSESDKHTLLQNSGYLFGVRIDNIDGPRRSMHPVATYTCKPGSTPCVRVIDNILTEVITCNTERESNYVHQGWSRAAVSVTSPWIRSRIANKNQPNPDGVWVTKRNMLQRIMFSLKLEDLAPAPEFEAEIEAALGKPTTFQKFQAIYQTFQTWGDVLPLEYDVGVSLAYTDTEANFAQLQNSDVKYFNIVGNLLISKTVRVAKMGGDSDRPEWDTGLWPTMSIPPLQWCQIRVVSAVPTTDLLSQSLKERLWNLYVERLLSFFPPLMPRPSQIYKPYDDSRHALRTLASVSVCTLTHFGAIWVSYRDNRESDRHGEGGIGCPVYSFLLADGEHIIDVIIWHDQGWVYGLQFVTSSGRCSPHYGGSSGTPSIARSKGGVLVGFSSLVHWEPCNSATDLLSRLQGIWRHDILDVVPKEDDEFSEYYGGGGGVPFNDRSVVRNSNSMSISSVIVRREWLIDSIQLTYDSDASSRNVKSKTDPHGGLGGAESVFMLSPGEYIVTVSGRYNDEYMTQLCFVTNSGRTSEVFGVGTGEPFTASAPQAMNGNGKRMHLHYICGKSEAFLNGIMFVWTPI